MKLRWKILIAAGVLLVLLAASLTVTMHVQPQNELAAYKKFLRDKGEKLDLDEVTPPPIAPESNSVNAVEDAFRLFGSAPENIPNTMTMVAPGKALIGWSQPDARGYDFTNSWDAFGVDIEASQPAIELLHQVLARPKLYFQHDYNIGLGTLTTQLPALRRSARKLDAAVIYELHNGNSDMATTNILTLLALVQKSASGGLLISHLVRMAMASLALPPTWELVQATNVTDTQLAAVQDGWEKMNFLSDAENAFVIDRAWSSVEIQKSRASREKFNEMFDLGTSGGSSSSSSSSGWDWPLDWDAITEGPRSTIGAVLWQSSWSYSDELRMLKSSQVILETLRTMQTNHSRFYKADYDTMLLSLPSLDLTNASEAICDWLNIPNWGEIFDGSSSFGNVVAKTLRIEAARDVVITAIALKRFQLESGKWPETLEDLTPKFLSAVPIDPFDGKPLKYHPNADGTFLLYSVGEDGVDNGGDPTTTSSSAAGSSDYYWEARDWVWPQPASPAEVQSFYEHPPK